jgi:hypothetical protein
MVFGQTGDSPYIIPAGIRDVHVPQGRLPPPTSLTIAFATLIKTKNRRVLLQKTLQIFLEIRSSHQVLGVFLLRF